MTRGHRSSVIDIQHQILEGVDDGGNLSIVYNGFILDVLREAIESLDLPTGSKGLDLACGPGGVLPLLIEAVGDSGHVTAIDISEDHLERARKYLESKGIESPVRFIQGDITRRLDLNDDELDWAWSSDALTPDVCEKPREVVEELHRVVRPGGTLALFFEHSHRELFMPGHPAIEKEIQLFWDSASWICPAGDHFENAASWLRAAGFEDVRQTPYILQRTQPLDDHTKLYCAANLLHYKALVNSDVFGADLDTLKRMNAILSPDSDDYLLSDPDYYCMVTAVLTTGRVAAE